MKFQRVLHPLVLFLLLRLVFVQLQSKRQSLALLFNYSSQAKAAILRSSPNVCLLERGSSGQWIQDWDYANRSSYLNFGSYSTWHLAASNFTPTPEQPFRLATSYRWEDDSCPLQEVNYGDFCQACYRLHIHQVLVMGDSLSIEFLQSLQSLLGFPPTGRRAHSFNARFRPWTMKCPQHNIIFLMKRMSPATDWLALQKGTASRQFISESEAKTVIIANMGAWIKSKEEYKSAFQSFVSWLASLEHNNATHNKAISFFRPTIPGHLGCLPSTNETSTNPKSSDINKNLMKSFDWKNVVSQEPYRNYNEYITNQEEILSANSDYDYQWMEFEEFNSWSQTYVNASSGKGPRLHWLNIFPSSVRRRDGHIGFGDCLHYYLPGPIDWWSHFFQSSLMDLAAIQQQQEFSTKNNSQTTSATQIQELKS